MKEESIRNTNEVLENFINLFVLEMKYDKNIEKYRSLSDIIEAIQLCLEPSCYEDIPLIKNMQEYVKLRIIDKNSFKFTIQEEISVYFDQIFINGTLSWTEQEIIEIWNRYSDFEKKRMIDFIKLFDGVYDYISNYNTILREGRKK